MNLIQQNSLITYITSHKGNCDCSDCQYFGGIKHLFEIFEQENFTDNNLRRIWGWLKRQYNLYGNCELATLNFDDPTAPKISAITQCHLNSHTEPYIKLKDIIYV